MPGLHDPPDQPKDRGVKRLVKIGDVLVDPVDRQRVLNQVVRADAEESDLLREQVGHDRRGGDLDHDPDGHLLVVGDPPATKLPPHLLDHAHRLPKLPHPGDHREHHPNLPVRRGAQDRPELGLEDLFFLQAEPDRPQPHRRVHLVGELELGRELVAAEVEGADRDRVAHELLRHLPVRLEVLLLGREILPVEEEELRPVEPHPVGAAAQRNVRLLGEFDVRQEQQRLPVTRDRRQPRELRKVPGPLRVGLSPLLVIPDHLHRRVEDDHPFFAVDDDRLRGPERLRPALHSDDRRDPEGARRDRGVGRPAPHVGGEAEHRALQDLRGVRR